MLANSVLLDALLIIIAMVVVEVGRYSLMVLPTAYPFFFTFVIPIVFLTTVPAEVIVGRVTVWSLLNGGLLAIGLLFVSNRFWRFALRFCMSTSS
jgi:ABC-2 type transport system permease protein